MIDHALRYAEDLGFRVLPLHWITPGGCSCGSAKCPSPGKHPLTRTGVNEASSDTNQIAHWWKSWPEANVGIASGKYSGIAVLDIDNKQGGLEKLEALKEEFPEIKKTLSVSTGGGGYHFYFRYPKKVSIGCRNKIDGFGIDVRGDGGYLVAAPSKHISGHNYDWLDVNDEPDLSDLIDASPNLLEYMGTKDESEGKLEINADGEVLVGEELVAKIRSALQRLSPYGDVWLHCGMAIFYATGGHIKGFEIWNEWAQSAPEYEHISPSRHLKRYASFNTERVDHISDATLWQKARENDWVWVDPDQSLVFDTPFLNSRDYNAAKNAGTLDTPPISSFSKCTPQLEVAGIKVPGIPESEVPEFFDIDELNEISRTEEFETFWQGHVLFRGCVFLMAGEPKVGKSTLFLQMAKAAAIGGEFLGHKFERPIRALWIQAEIARHYVSERVNVVASDLSVEERALFKKNFRATPRLDLSISNDTGFSKIIGMITKFKPDLICIDPLINFSDANENDNSEVRQLMRRVAALTEVIPEESAVAFLHHTSKTSGKFAPKNPFDMIRGAGAIRGAYDSGLVLTNEPKNHLVKVSYETRNGKEPIEHGIRRGEEGLFFRCDLPTQQNEKGQHQAVKIDENTPRDSTEFRLNFLLDHIQENGQISRQEIKEKMTAFGLKERSERKFSDLLKAHSDEKKQPLIGYNQDAKATGETLTFWRMTQKGCNKLR